MSRSRRPSSIILAAPPCVFERGIRALCNRRTAASSWTCLALLCRLEDEDDPSTERLFLRLEDAGGTQHHGHVSIVAARMHLARMLALERKVIRFAYREAVHVGSECHNMFRVSQAHVAQDAGLGHARLEWNPHLVELLLDPTARLNLLRAARNGTQASIVHYILLDKIDDIKIILDLCRILVASRQSEGLRQFCSLASNASSGIRWRD